MNKKFLSTLLTVVATSFTLNAAPVAKARAKVVEVEMAPAKLIELKVSPLKAINEGTVDFALESGYYNFAGELSGSWLYSRTTKFLVTANEKTYFKGSALKFNLNAIYYANENRRTGLYWYLGGSVVLGADYKKDENLDTNGYHEISDKNDMVFTAHAGIGHKIELYDFLFVSNSIELPNVLAYIPGTDYPSGITNQEKANALKDKVSYPLLSNFRVNLLEVRVAF